MTIAVPIKGTDVVIQFPDGTPPDEIERAMREFVASSPPQQQQVQTATPDEIDQALNKIPGAPALTEFASGVNRSLFGAIDFLGPDNINAILRLSGSDKRVPTLTGEFAEQPGAFVSGLEGQMLGTAGETAALAAGMQQALRRGAQGLSAEAQGTLPNLVRMGAEQTTQSAAGLGAISGIGEELGRETTGTEEGALVGAVLAPATFQGGVGALKGVFDAGKRSFDLLSTSLDEMSDEGAAQLLATAMVREGLTPEQVSQRLTQLGPEAIIADTGINFMRRLRAASNLVPRIEGQAGRVFAERQAGQDMRILSAMDDATGTSSLNLSDEIIRLKNSTRPQINRLYAQARAQPLRLSDKLRTLMEGDNSIGRAQKRVQRRLADKRALGEEITNIDVIDATKKELGDQIGKAMRTGEMEKARDLIQLKNFMVDEADKSIPVYREARNLFAGVAQLENAGDLGRQFFKMKPSDVDLATKTMSTSEREVFKLGAKEALLERMDALDASTDIVRRVFSKRGEIKKLRTLFENKESFDRFRETLEREAQFILTRRQAQANSTTTKQLSDDDDAAQVLEDMRRIIVDPVETAGFIRQVLTGMSASKKEAVFTESMEKVGDMLLATGLKPERVRRLLARESQNEIRRILQQETKKARRSLVAGQRTAATVAGLAPERQEQTQQQ